MPDKRISFGLGPVSDLFVLPAEISRARHLQSPPPDVKEGGASAPHAEKSALQSQVEKSALWDNHIVVDVNSFDSFVVLCLPE